MKRMAVLLLIVALTCGCASRTASTAPPPSVGASPTDSEVAPPLDLPMATQIGRETACELVRSSPTLTELGANGTPADTRFIVALSFCDVALDSTEYEPTRISVSIVTGEHVALAGEYDAAVYGGSLVPLPDLGESGHFLAPVANAHPSDDPRSGSILAARRSLGVTLSWAMDEPIPYATFEQVVRELLDELG